MYKVELIDDEYNNIQLFEAIIPWEDYGFSIVTTASDGQEGIERYLEYEPDIVFIDIKMPIMDGISCMKKIREIHKQTIIILVSAYGEFDYAQEAIRNDVYQYILKPISRKILTELIVDLKRILDQRYQSNLSTLKLQKQTLVNEITSLLSHSMNNLNSDKKYLNGLLPYFPIGMYCFVSIKVFSEYEKAFQFGESMIQMDELEEYMKENHLTTLYCFSNDTVGNLLVYQQSIDLPHLRDILLTFMKLNYVNLNYDIHIFEQEITSYNIESIIHDIIFYPGEHFYLEESSISIVASLDNEDSSDSSIFNLKELEMQIIKAIAQQNKVDLLMYLDTIYTASKDSNIAPNHLKDYMLTFLILLKKHLTIRFNEKTFHVLRGINMNVINQSFRFASLFFICEKYVNDVFDTLRFYKNTEALSPEIYAAIEFSKLNYMKTDFSVQLVADYIGLSKNYFLKLFKDYYHQSFWDFITELRITQAKFLLLNTNKTLSEISQSIGYESEYHLCRKFKEITGIPPIHFRKTQ